MATKTKTFDAVEESRKWRETTSRKLDSMSPHERVAYLHEVAERYRSDYLRRHGKTQAFAS
jgi:hypothetical protein